MGVQLWTNNATSTLAAPVSNVALSIQVATGDGGLFPSPSGGDYFYASMCKVVSGVETTVEIVKCTARSADILTIVRAQESTTAQTYTTGDRLSLRMTAGFASRIATTDDAQTLQNKTLKAPGLTYYDSGTSNAVNASNGTHQRWAPSTGAQTLTITGWPTSGVHGELMIEGVNLGASTITWPAINWVKPDGTFTTSVSTYLASKGVTLQSSGIDWLVLWTRDGGTTIYGAIIR